MPSRGGLRRPAALLILGGGLALADPLHAQELAIPEAVYPALPRNAPAAEGFVPPGWVLESRAEGDLDRDGLADLALVLRQTGSANVVANDGLGENPFDTNPRMLAVALRMPSGGYRLALENRTLIPRRVDPVMADPLSEGGIAIARGALKVTLHLFMSAGGWSMSQTTYTLRLRDGRMELIGFDRRTAHRGSGETDDVSVNYLTGRMKRSSGHVSEDEPRTVVWTTMPHRPPPDIDAVGDGLSFGPD
jgi:hypothetical protein